MEKGVLIDYTTLVSANNVLNCHSSFYPATTINPYANLLNGQKTPSASPMWLELASLADVIEAIVIHEKLLILNVILSDRILDKGRYQIQASDGVQLYSSIKNSGSIDMLDVTRERFQQVLDWFEAAAQDDEFLEAFLISFFQVLKQPVYSSIPDLFSHSQTIYKFDGEAVWSHFKQKLNARKFSRQYNRIKKRTNYLPQLRYTQFFYAEDMIAFFLRGLLYNEVAKAEAVPYHPHTVRSIIAMSDGLWCNGKSSVYGEIPIEYIVDMRAELAKSNNQDLQHNLFELKIPPIFASVLRESQKPEDIPIVALQMRNSKSAQAFREWIKTVYTSDSGLKLVEIQRDLNNLKQRMQLELGLETEKAGLGLWLFTFNIKIPKWAQKTFYLGNKQHLQFLRNLFLTSIDIINIEQELLRIFSS